MQVDNKTICNVCKKESSSDDRVVFLQAICAGENIHICTACIPQVIHGGSDIVSPNSKI
jgi:hypothetical protein